jgi:hypothetical protein
MEKGETRPQRAARYRVKAEEAEGFAEDTLFADSREKYLALAREWRLLAEALERGL